jgi:uncharacterized membrane protein YjjP (DUF1212 family)
LRDIKEIIIDYGIIGVTMGVMTMLIRPFISVKQTIRDCLITFIFSMLAGLLLEYWEIPYAVKAGISGVCGFFAVRLYSIAISFLTKVEENPDIIIDKIKK